MVDGFHYFDWLQFQDQKHPQTPRQKHMTSQTITMSNGQQPKDLTVSSLQVMRKTFQLMETRQFE